QDRRGYRGGAERELRTALARLLAAGDTANKQPANRPHTARRRPRSTTDSRNSPPAHARLRRAPAAAIHWRLRDCNRRGWAACNPPHPSTPTAPCDAGPWRVRWASGPHSEQASAPRSAARRGGPAPRPRLDWGRHRDRATLEASPRVRPRAITRRSAAGHSALARRR